MKTLFILIIATLLPTDGVFAKQSANMSPQTARCFTIHGVKTDHEKWKSDFEKFRQDNSLSDDAKYDGSVPAMRAVYNRLRNLLRSKFMDRMVSRETKELLADTEKFFKEVDAGSLTRESITRIYSTGTIKLKNSLDDILAVAPNLLNCEVAAPALFPPKGGTTR